MNEITVCNDFRKCDDIECKKFLFCVTDKKLSQKNMCANVCCKSRRRYTDIQDVPKCHDQIKAVFFHSIF